MFVVGTARFLTATDSATAPELSGGSQRECIMLSDSKVGLINFIREREEIRLRRAAGCSPPWTDDPILQRYSFTNVRREDDRVTRWIAESWRKPHADDPDLFIGMTVARFLNWPPTLAELGYPVPWDRKKFLATLSARKARGDQVFGAAYIVSTAGIKMDKIEYVAGVLDGLWAGTRQLLRPRANDVLGDFHHRLESRKGLAGFMAAQVVADMKYVAPLSNARDWTSFAASGPGSRRGLNRVLGRPVNAHWREDDWRIALRQLHTEITPELERLGLKDLHAQDLQNCLCEFDKYERTRLGEGTPKRRYVPRPD